MACSAPRNVYIDLGVNWCDTLTLFRLLPRHLRGHADRSWEVFGFEASPLIAAFAEQCMAALGAGRPLPAPPVPPTGSSAALSRYAARYGCSPNRTRLSFGDAHYAWLGCVYRAVQPQLARLREDPRLDRALLAARMRAAASCAGPTATPTAADRYRLLPAAVGASNGTMELFGGREQLLRGGLLARPNFSAKPWEHVGADAVQRVPVVDVGAWLASSFTRADFVVLKMDVEGAEQQIIPRLIELNASALVDVFLWECHPGRGSGHAKCHVLESALRASGVGAIFREPLAGPGTHAWARIFRRAEQRTGTRTRAIGIARRPPVPH